MERRIRGFDRDAAGDWRMHFDCGHRRHVRHDPPWHERPWVLDPTQRASRLGTAIECAACDRAELPDGCEPYRRTPEFDETSVPAGLLRDHQTRAGVWAHIHVLEGRLEYHRAAPAEASEVLTPASPGLVVPELLHRVAPLGRVRFFVEFLRVAG